MANMQVREPEGAPAFDPPRTQSKNKLIPLHEDDVVLINCPLHSRRLPMHFTQANVRRHIKTTSCYPLFAGPHAKK